MVFHVLLQVLHQVAGRLLRPLTDRFMSIRLSRTPVYWVWELEPEDFEAFEAEYAAANKSSNRAFAVTFVLSFVTLLPIGLWLLQIVEPRMTDPVWDPRSRFQGFGLLLIAIGLGMAASALVSRYYLRVRLGARLSLIGGFSAATRRRDPAFVTVACSLSGLMMAGMGLTATCLAGERIGQSGIQFAPHGFRAQTFDYADVQSVELFQSIDAPIGVVHSVNLQVIFRGGEVLRITDQRAARLAPQIVRTAEFVAGRSGVPLVRAETRPR